MGKRKYESEKIDSGKKSKNIEVEDGEEQPKSKSKSGGGNKANPRRFDVKHLRKELASKQGQNSVLTQFLQVCLNPDSEVDYLLEYLKIGGNSHEILRQVTADGKKNLSLVTPAFHLFHLIILKVQSSLPHMIGITEEACRYFLNNFMSTVEFMISDSSGPRHRIVVLKLLTSIVTFSPELGVEVINQAPLTPKHLQHIVEKSNNKEKDNVRTWFVHFMSSFLIEGHLPLIKALLEKPGLLGLVIPGLVYDDAEAVLIFLNILKGNVIENTFISKSLKLKTFNHNVLQNMFKIFTWKGPSEHRTDRESYSDIVTLLSEIILTLFTNHKIGLYFVDTSLGTTDANKNPNLYKALLPLKKPWMVTEEGDVILQIVYKCPDLHRAVLSIIEQNFEPQQSLAWEKTIDFTIKLLNKLRPEDMLARMSSLNPSQVANFIRSITLPIPLLKQINMNIGKDVVLSMYCLKVITKMLQVLRRYMQILEMGESSHVTELKNRLEYFVPKHLPPPIVVVSMIEKIVANKGATKDTKESILPVIKDTEALILLVDLLLLYNDIHPSYFESLEGNINMKKLLQYSVSLQDNNVSLLKFKVVSLWLTLDQSLMSLKNDMFQDLFLIMLDVYMSDDDTWIEAKKTLKTFFKNTSIFDADEDEIHLMLYALRKAKVDPPSLIGEIVEYVLENFEDLEKTVRDQLVNFEISDENCASSLEKLFTDLMDGRSTEDSVFLENKVPSPFLVGCVQFLQSNRDKKKSLKHFLSLYVTNLMHSNSSPEFTEVLIGDTKLDARNYVASWTGEPVALTEATAGSDEIIKNTSRTIIDGEDIPLVDVFPFIEDASDAEKDFVIHDVSYKVNTEKHIDGSDLLIWAKYLIFCNVKLTDLNRLTEDQQKKISDYIECMIAVCRKLHMIDISRVIILNLFKNPQVLKIYKVIDLNNEDSSLLATKFLLNIIVNHKDIVNHLDKKHKILKSYQLKNYNELTKAFVKMKKRKNVNSEHTLNVLEIVGMTVEDDLRVFNQIFNAEITYCVKDDKEPSIVLEILRNLVKKYSKSVNLKLQQQTQKQCMKLYTELLTNKEMNPNLTELEVTLTEYFENKPNTVKSISDDIFKKFFEAPNLRKSTCHLASVLLKHNVRLCSTFKEFTSKPEILSQRELTLPLGNSAINHNQFILENKEFLATIYNEYKSNINKILEKPHKAGQVYINNAKFIKKLILECMDMPECEKLFLKIHKFECLEINHLHIFQTVFLKLCSSELVKKEHFINYLLAMLHITTFSLKENKDVNVVYEIVKDVYSILQLSPTIPTLQIDKKDEFKKITDSAIWQNFCKAVLKDSIKVKTANQEVTIGPQLLCLLTNLVKLLYMDEHGDIETLFDMVTSHSEFLNVMLSHHSSDIKSRLLELLYTLILRNKSVMKNQQVPVYLSSYHATRGPCDRLIMAILYYYESNGLPVNEYKPYVWGDSGANHYAVRKNRTSSLWGHPTPNQVLNLFDKEIIERTVRNFPVTQKLTYHYELPSNIDGENNKSLYKVLDNMEEDGVLKNMIVKDGEGSVKAFTLRGKYSEVFEGFRSDMLSRSHKDDDEDIYDPVFVFPLLSHVLAPGSAASSFKMLRSGLLALPVVALSSLCPDMRAAAYHVLHRFCMLLDTETRHKNDKLFLSDFITTLRNSIASAQNIVDNNLPYLELKNPRIPALASLYLARALMVSTAPADPLYKPVNNFLIAKQFVDLTVVPDFLSLFHDSDVESAERKLWILDIIKDGIVTMTDVNVVFKTMCLKMMMDYFSSVLSDRKVQEKILDVLSAVAAVPRAAEILVEGHGLISWLHSAVRQVEAGEKTLINSVLKLIQNVLYSLKINSLVRKVVNKTIRGKALDCFDIKINKDIENVLLVILYDLIHKIDETEEDLTNYFKTFNLITKNTIKSLNNVQIMNLVNKVGKLYSDSEKLKLLTKALVANDSNVLKSKLLADVSDNSCLRELIKIVQSYLEDGKRGVKPPIK